MPSTILSTYQIIECDILENMKTHKFISACVCVPCVCTLESFKSPFAYKSLGQSAQNKLNADRPHPRNYPHTPTDYRHTDKHLRLLMPPIAPNCTRQSRAPNIDHCAPEK